ncbi:MAG: arylsulfatase [Massilibacteroides sp.]|nr:arylsulfatase [Massilibacteroides sp.]
MKPFLLGTSLFLLVLPFAVKAQHLQKPNVVIFLADDQGWGDLAVDGNKMVHTPNIDGIAREGVSFENFYVCPVSAPTRAEFLTGRYAYKGHVTGVSEGRERLDINHLTIGDYFKKAGYKTGAFGKWHNGLQYPYHPNARGFEEFYGYCSGHWGNYWNPLLDHNGAIVKGKGFLTDDLTNHAIDFIKKNKDKPFFVYIPFNTPHSPMQVTDRWWKPWQGRYLLQQATEKDREVPNHTRAALALSENIDWNVGRVTQTLQQLGLDENTILVYFSDNGPNSHRWNGNMQGIKASVEEGGIRSPLFMRWHGHLPAGKNIKQLSACLDLTPTLLELVGVKESIPQLDGINLTPYIMGDASENKRFVYRQWGQKSSLHQNKYILSNDENLYDLEEDRAQKSPLNSQYPVVYQALKEKKEALDKACYSVVNEKDRRPFLLADPNERYSKLPARDGIAKGTIMRSNRFPNSSYFTHWTSPLDEINWHAEICETGYFEAILYYTCKAENIGSEIELTCGTSQLTVRLEQANDSPLIGAALDRIPRQESYMQDFKPFHMGTIHLHKGEQTIRLRAPKIPGSNVMDLYMLVFKRK